MYSVGLPGIEPGLYEPESYVLPVYYSPTQHITGCTLMYQVGDIFETAGYKEKPPSQRAALFSIKTKDS